VPGPLNANKLLQRAGFARHTKMTETVRRERSQSKMERLKKKWQHVEYNRMSLNG